MNSNERMQRESTNLVLKSFPKEKAVLSDIAIIDHRSCIRDAIANAIRGNSERRIFTANTAESLELTAFCNNPAPRQFILFCDGSLDAESVNQEVKKLSKTKPDAKIALLTDKNLDDTTPGTLSALDGVIPSSYETEQVLACISVIESGVRYLPASTVESNTARNTENAEFITREAVALLTPRQRQVMDYIAEGKANKYIAAELSVSESTIKVHVHEAMKRLGATSRTHAVYIMTHRD